MVKKPTYQELEQRVKEFQRESSELERVDEALRKSEQEKAAILDSMTELVAYQDMEMRVLWANKAAGESVNLPPEKLVGRHCYKIWQQRSKPCADCPVVKALETGEPQQTETTTPDGRVWFIQGYPIVNAKGDIIGAVETTLEITERKRAEEALRKEKDRTQKYLDIAGVMFVGIDDHQSVTLANQKACEVLGYTQEDIVGKSWFDNFLPESMRAEVKSVYDRMIAGDLEPIEYFENPVLTKDGEERIIAWHNTIIRDEQDNITGTLSSGEDITQRKQAEETLLESEERYRQSVENSPNPIFSIDKEGIVQAWNRSCEQVFQYSSEEIIGQAYHKLLMNPEDLPTIEAMLAQVWQGESFSDIEMVYRCKDGTLRFTISRLYPLRLYRKDIQECVFANTNITERRRAENLMRTQRDLGVSLGAVPGLDEGLRLCVEAACRVSGMDCGGVYLIDKTSGALDLIFHKGLPPGFVKSVSHYDADSANMHLVMAGKPIYTQHQRLGVPLDETELGEELRAIAVLPVHHEDRVIGCLNIASHALDEVPVFARVALEAITTQIGSAIVRLGAEKALRESEEQFSLFMDYLPAIVFIKDKNGKTLYVNKYMNDVLGAKDWIGKSTLELFPKDVAELMIADDKKTMSKGYQEVVEKLPDKNNKINTYQTYKFRIDRHGMPPLLGGIALDITKRLEAEEALREGEKRYRTLVETSPDVIFSISTRDEKITSLNPTFNRITGWSDVEWMGKPFISIIHPDDLPIAIEKFQQVLSGKTTSPFELRIPSKSGEDLIGEFIGTPEIKSGKVVNILGFARDITDRVHAEKALRDSEQKYRLLAENVSDMIWMMDIYQQRLTYVSPSVKKMRGYSPKEVMEQSLDEILTPESYQRAMQTLADQLSRDNELEPDRFVSMELEQYRRYGNTMWTEITVSFVRDSEKRPIAVLGVTRDITDRKQAEEALRKSEEKLTRSRKMESIGLLAGGVAHDLNNVLSGIVSYPDLLLMDLPEDSKLRKPIETMQESGYRAAAIVQDLLTVARGIATTKEPLNLNVIVSDYLNSPEFNKLKQFYPTVTVKTGLDTDLFNIGGSPVHIRKVVMNLVANASEAIEGKGNVTISTMNRYVDRPLRGYDDVTIGEYAVLAVSDDGSGISSDDLERIFEPFYTKKVMSRSGTGLGLAVVWNVVQDHKGYIDVTSDENGTTFELYFPITRDEISDKALAIPIKDFKGNGETILVVDDVESQREISCNMLDTLGYKTNAVSSDEEAVEYLKENTVDLLLLDMIMDPGINGRETYKRIIKIHPNQKAIIISGFAETDEVKKTQKLGAGQYIKKPVTLEKIGLAIKEELGK